MKKLLLLTYLGFILSFIGFSQTNHTGNITTSEVWFASGNPHIITGNVTVANGVTLVIAPGCEVRFEPGRRMTVQGTLSASGSPATPIVFTSNQVTPNKGDWQFIYFDGADFGSLMNYCEVSYGGVATSGMIYVRNSTDNVTITNCDINNSIGNGIYLNNNAANPSISNSTISDCNLYPIYTRADRVKDITGTMTFTGNTRNAIYVVAQNVNTGTWLNHGVPYVIGGSFTVNDSETWTIDPGSELRFHGVYAITVSGAMVANGTSAEHITFTSNQATPAKGDWNRIYFNAAESSSLTYCDFNYAGSANATIDVNASLSNVSISNCLIDNSFGYGIYNRGNSLTAISNTTIQNCNSFPIYTTANQVPYITGSMVFATTNTFNDIWVIGQTISASASWSDWGIPYILGNGDLRVNDGLSLTLEAGTDFKIDGNRQFQIYGALIADGDAANHITFTSNSAAPVAGSWENIMLNGADAGSILDYCDFNYGGSVNGTVYTTNSLSNISISNCSIENSGTYGIYVAGTSTGAISDCSISNCGDYAIRTAANAVKNITGTMTIAGNSPNAIRVDAQNIYTGTWLNHGVPYVMWGDMTVIDLNTLTLTPGSTLKFNAAARLLVYGALNADGDAANHFTFTSNAAIPVAGDWEHVYFSGAETSILDYCDFSYGGSANGQVFSNNSGTNVTISNCSFENSGTYGVRVAGNSDGKIIDCSFTNNNSYAVRTLGDAVKNLTGTLTFLNNSPDAIWVDAQTINGGTWLNHGVPYAMWADMNVADGTTLTLSPGITMKFNPNARLQVLGGLIADGDATNHFTFTSNSAIPASGDWENIYFNVADASILDYCDFTFGGSVNGQVYSYNSGANVTISNSTFSNSGTYGVRIAGTSLGALDNCSFNDNNDYPIRTMGNAVKNLTGVITFANNSPDAIRVDAQNIYDGTWLNHGVPYAMWADMTVMDLNTLTLSAGITMKFNPAARLLVYGGLVADGDAANHLTFTSNASIPVPGDWDHIYFNAAETSLLDYCDFSYGGSADGQVYSNNSLGNVTISNSSFDNSGTYGVRIAGNSLGTLDNCSFTNNNDYPIRTMGNAVKNLTGVISFTNNSPDAIRVDAQNIYAGTWINHNVPYIMWADMTVMNLNTLTLSAGITLKFNPTARLLVYGGLIADGDAANHFTFTSNEAAPAAGDWESIYFYQAETSLLDYCDFNYGGSGTTTVEVYNSLSNVTISNCSIDNSGGYGIYNRGNSLTAISNSTLQNCDNYPIYTTANQVTYTTGAMVFAPTNSPNAIWVYGQSLNASAIWHNWNVPYILGNADLRVLDGFNLTLEPGTVMKVDGDRQIRVDGSFTADGDPANHITFTSNSLTPMKGDWENFYFVGAEASLLDYCDISYAGSLTSSIDIYNSLSNVTISNCLIENSGDRGIYNRGTSYTHISNTTLQDCDSYPIYTIANQVTNITGAMVFSASNAPNQIYVVGQTLNATATWLNWDIPYILYGNITVPDGLSWTLNQGNEIRVAANNTINVYGNFIADGSSAEHITFTSNQATPAKGDWGRIYLYQAETSLLDYCDFSYGGSGTSQVEVRSCGNNVTISNCLFDNSGGYGLYNRGGSYTALSNTTFQNCDSYPIYTQFNQLPFITGAMVFDNSNTPNEIWATGETLANTFTLVNWGVPYVWGNADLNVPNTLHLTISPDITIKVDGNRQLIVYGELDAVGTSSEPIVFTSNSSSPASGNWENIHLNGVDGICDLEFVTVEYAGSQNGAIYTANNAGQVINIIDCEISNSLTYGIYNATSSSARIESCSIHDNGNYAIRTGANTVGRIGPLTSTIVNNTPNKIRVDAQTITDDWVWYDHNVPYTIWGDVTLADGNTLMLVPNNELHFRSGASLITNGTLIADGDASNHITFTSNQNSPAAGDWEYLYFNGADGGTVLDYCDISYAGSNNAGALYVVNSGNNVNISNCSFDNSSSYGINVNANSNPSILNCSITDCGNYAIRTAGDRVKSILGNMTITGNTPNAIRVESQAISTGTWLNHNVPYVIWADIDQVNSNTLTLEPGIQLNFNTGARLRVYGRLIADGDESNHITFTSNQAIPAPGDWERILFNGADAGTILDYCDISYGGSTYGNIDVYNSGTNVSFTNCVIENSFRYGVYIRNNSAPSFINNQIINNNDIGVYIDGNNAPTFGSNDLEWNDIYGNGFYDLRNGNLDIDAKYIFWGVSGCAEVPARIYDEEDQASLGIVDYVPWLGAGHIEPVLATTWTGDLSTSWHDNGNWDNDAPCSPVDVTIPEAPANQPIVSMDDRCKDLTMEAGAELTVNTGSILSVDGDFLMESDVDTYGSVVEDFGLNVAGNSTVEYYLEGERYYHTSTPMTGQVANVFYDIYLYDHDENTNNFLNIVPEDTPLNVGKGYQVWSDDKYLGTTTVSYSGGLLNTGTTFLPVTNSGSGWNFVANPYPSAVDWDDFSWIKLNIDATVYVWDGALGQYLTWNGSVGDLTDGVIPAMQSFFVKATNTPILVVSNGSRVHGPTPYKESVADLLELEIVGNGYSDKMFINFNENATAGFDNDYDGYKLEGYVEAPQFYSKAGDEKLKINVLPEVTADLVIPVELVVGSETTYTIYSSNLGSFTQGTAVYLEDLKEGVMINLSQQPDYTFIASPIDDPDRFLLHFGTLGVDEMPSISTNNGYIIYASDNSVYIKNLAKNDSKGLVKIYNIMGQEIHQSNLENIPVNKIDLYEKAGYYIVKVFADEGIYSEKVFIK